MARRLTHRQLEVLELIAKGLTNTEIGRVLGISLGTVKSHVSAVIETLGASNRTEVAGMLAELELGQRAPQIAAGEEPHADPVVSTPSGGAARARADPGARFGRARLGRFRAGEHPAGHARRAARGRHP